MIEWSYLLAGLFLPLFPLSMVFNLVFARLPNPMLRAVLLLVWPQIGLYWLAALPGEVPHWLMTWALFTSVLYSVRALALREVGLWTCFIATSAWSLLWLLVYNEAQAAHLPLYALGFSAPLALLSLLGAGLERRFGAAYTGLYGGLAQTIPRFAVILVFTVLAIVATPLFPGFFAMLAAIITTASVAPGLAAGVGIVWLIWSWAGARLLQGLIVGPAHETAVTDLSRCATWAYAGAVGILLLAGIRGIGGLL